MVRTFTIQGYGPTVITAKARFTGALSDARRIADELARAYGGSLTAVVVTTDAESDEIVYVTYQPTRRH